MTAAIRPSGAALLLVLWAITVISFAVLWMANVVNLELETTVSDSAGLRARQIAVSGVALGLHPQVKRDDTELLNRDYYRGRFASPRAESRNGMRMIFNWEETPIK